MKILAINPGGTSTKIAVFDGAEERLNVNVKHAEDELHRFAAVFDQLPLRRQAILDVLKAQGVALEDLAAVVGRGGLLRSVSGGTYAVNQAMVDDLRNAVSGEHPSNLGPVLAKDIADPLGIPSFIVDPVSVDEFDEVARVSGLADIERPSWLHALNHKAVCRKVAGELGGSYADFNFIVAHLGSGISIAAHRRGRMVDGSGGRSNGPFSPERCGSLPAYPLVGLCFSGKYTHEELVRKISTQAGMFDYLGTKDMVEIERRYAEDDADAVLALNAFVLQTCKDIGGYAAALEGKVDRIIVTGGIAHSDLILRLIRERVQWIADVAVVPGEMEMQALALGALRVLDGTESVVEYAF
ncbi:butyrate kinase [Paucidesulfovibrio gracilis DSM 16080]|uniref:Probable butyrate kinase n=1 Tax=Paucidesulfovibrio gracilis DSM 16080 TaxID=1121449 RepID=A0A1T4WZ22_9BACT|nr:butyrate kinase [Paucidesulfovibrio gracilis]SKA82600.1 butyrate kinase [Paucidesulfovibrio gracilis DSM 16080]